MEQKQPMKNTNLKNLLDEEIETASELPTPKKRRKPDESHRVTLTKKKKDSPLKGKTETVETTPKTRTRVSQFPAGTKTIAGKQYDIKMVLEVHQKASTVSKPKKAVRTLERVIDEHGQVFNTGTVTVALYSQFEVPEERLMVMEAEDVEILLKLLEVAEL